MAKNRGKHKYFLTSVFKQLACSIWQLLTFLAIKEEDLSIMNDVSCHRLSHFDCLTANQMIRSTAHVTHCVLEWAPTVICGHCLRSVISRFFMYDVVASTLQKCRFRYPCWCCKNAGTVGWIASLLSIHLCVSVFSFPRGQEPPFLNKVHVLSVHWLIGHVAPLQVVDLDQPICLLSKWVVVALLK